MSATERKTTPVATSSTSSNRNVSCGSSTTSGLIVEARIPAMRPAPNPPATAAITTASMNRAIEISGRVGAKGNAIAVAIAGVISPITVPRSVNFAVPSASCSSLTTTTR